MVQRVLEPEVMDSEEEAIAYDAMDFREVNQAFADGAVALNPGPAKVLDLGTGTARIPILMAKQRPQWQITAVDLAPSMLAIAEKHLQREGLTAQITLALVDSKQLPYGDRTFDLVVSNSLIHHLSDPLPCLGEIRRILKPGGQCFLRDLFRPTTEGELQEKVAAVADHCDRHQQQLFADSLRAAFTVAEISDLLKTAGFMPGPHLRVYQSSSLHWTAVFSRD